MSLITLTELKDYLGISGTDQDTELNIYVNSIDAIMEQLTGRKLALVSAQDYIYDGDGTRVLTLDHYPVAILHSFQYNDDNLGNGDRVDYDGSVYAVDVSAGLINIPSGLARGFRNIKVNITAWYDDSTAPQDLKLACFSVINEMKTQSKSAGIQAESVDGASLTYTNSMSASTKALLSNYMAYDI